MFLLTGDSKDLDLLVSIYLGQFSPGEKKTNLGGGGGQGTCLSTEYFSIDYLGQRSGNNS